MLNALTRFLQISKPFNDMKNGIHLGQNTFSVVCAKKDLSSSIDLIATKDHTQMKVNISAQYWKLVTRLSNMLVKKTNMNVLGTAQLKTFHVQSVEKCSRVPTQDSLMKCSASAILRLLLYSLSNCFKYEFF